MSTATGDAATNQPDQLEIQQVDPFYTERPYLDFQVLRAEGLAHIQALSGQIWTDNNLHDPGITILETLCYALIDLGYRGTLPAEDLFAAPSGASGPAADFSPDDNFFTPLEILSCNPTTVDDYRRLLLEVEGVRNAWLAPATAGSPAQGGEPPLYLRHQDGGQGTRYELTCVAPEGDPTPLQLNGLWSVLIEKEPGADDDTVFQGARTILSAHRNLCEDFKEIVILCPLEVGICADVEVEQAADTAAVYTALLAAVRAFIAPEIQYYTLQQLLDKGKPIEDIFAGRPFRQNSVGFVDVDEFATVALKTELRASELYRVILAVSGVVSVRELMFQTEPASLIDASGLERLRIPQGYAAAFSLERTCIQLRSGQNLLQVDKQAAAAALSQTQKPTHGRADLDLPIPQGSFDPERADYDSIQQEFPKVYGIGLGGLSKDATPLRQAQALQLQGYLLFYDQLLANYLAQMAHVRSLFSLRQESKRGLSERHTYFNQAPDMVPAIEQLLQAQALGTAADGSVIAVPVANDNDFAQKLQALGAPPPGELRLEDICDPRVGDVRHFGQATDALRDISVKQSIRDFGEDNYTVEAYEDTGGWFFVLRFSHPCAWLLVGLLRYPAEAQARSAGDLAAFLGTRPDYYRKSIQRNALGSSEYRFDLVSNAAADAACLQDLLEDERLYLERREAFLDHLLARFANQFTDYALVRFAAAERKRQHRRQAIEDKSAFLSRYDKLSRNRGRAFDYLEPSWATGNVSGYEKRTCLLAGMAGWVPRRLCKFEVVECYRIHVADPAGTPWFSSKADYHSEPELAKAKAQLMETLRTSPDYGELEGRFVGFDATAVRRIFSEFPAEENLEVSRHGYLLQLKDSAGLVRQQSTRQDYASEALAWGGLSQFLDAVKGAGESGLELVEVGQDSHLFVDNRQLRCRLDTVVGCKWHQYDENGRPVATAQGAFADTATAVADFAEHGDSSRFITSDNGFGWRLANRRGIVLMANLTPYPDAAAAIKGLLEALEAVQVDSNLFAEATEAGSEYRILLGTPDGRRLGAAPPPYPTNAKARDAALRRLRRLLKRVPAPLKIEPEPPRYRWHLCRVPGGESLMELAQAFESSELAADDCAGCLRRMVAERARPDLAQYVYTIESLPIPAQYRFLYCLTSPAGAALPLLRSAQEFASPDAAKAAYTAFIRSLPTLHRAEAAVADATQTVAVLTADTPENRQKTDQVLACVRTQYGAAAEKATHPAKWIYRVLDKDHPIAKTTDSFLSKAAAQGALPSACGFQPVRLECGKLVFSILVPALDPGRYHYAMSLPDDAGQEFLFLISYEGYDTPEAARAAAEAECVELIGLASDAAHYGANQWFGTDETYGPGADAPAQPQSYRAVLPKGFTDPLGVAGAVAKAVGLAKRYPIRIAYKADSSGTPSTNGYRFQGYDPASDKVIWASTLTYATLEETLQAYRVFLAALGNGDGCRLVCEQGKYRVHLLEILAESREFDSAAAAWDEPQPMASDPCGQPVCVNRGVRLFADAATSEAAFIPRHEGDCYEFIVVGPDYRVARHTCSYQTAGERDLAAEKACTWASALTFPAFRQSGGGGAFLRFDLGEGYYLKSINRVLAGSEDALIDRWFYLAITKLSYSPAGNGWQLVDHLQGDTPIADAARDAGAGEFSLEAFVELARKYPVFPQGSSYRFRLYYPDNGKELDEVLEKCLCPEPVEKLPEPRPFCGQPYIFESVQGYPCRAAAEQAFKNFCDLLKTQANYEGEAESGIGPFSFVIVNPGQVLARYPNCLRDLGDVMRAAERVRNCLRDEGMHLLEHILLRPQAQNKVAACNCLLPVCPVVPCQLTWQDDAEPDDPCAAVRNPAIQYIPGADPYSFWATLALPAWHRRFKDQQTRQFLEQMLHREAPAAVGLNILWLSPRQMCEFEEAFRRWLDWQRCPESVCEDKEDILCNLVNCFRRLRADPTCPSAASTPAECACLLPQAPDPPYPCIEQADELFWLQCDPGATPPAATPVAAGETAPAPKAAGGEVSLQPAAIRQTLAQRETAYRSSVGAAGDAQVKASKGYQQAVFFVNNPPSLEAFGKLTAQVLEKDLPQSGARAQGALAEVLRNATWYLLDKLVQGRPKQVPEGVKSFLSTVFAAMKAKGIDTSRMAVDWQSEPLERVLHAPAIQVCLNLLEHA